MSKADGIFKDMCMRIFKEGYSTEGEKVRPRWEDGTPAYTIKKFGIINEYDLSEEFPIITLRPTAFKSAIDEILWIWQKKSNNAVSYTHLDVYKRQGKYALDLQLHAKGIDYSQVMPNSPDDIKSIGRSTTLPNDTNDINYLEQVLLELAEEVGKTARRYCKKGRVVHITIKYSDFTSISRQRTLHPTNSTQEIYKTGCDLIRKNINPLKPVRLIGITLKDFDVNRSVQQLSFLEGSHSIKNDRIDRIMDELQNKYGVERIGRGSTFLKKNGND